MENKNNQSFKITGEWAPQASKLKERFKQLTDSDLTFETGKENELVNRISKKTNKKPEEVIDIIKKM